MSSNLSAMNKVIFLLVMGLNGISMTFGQVNENVRTMSKGNENALSIIIEGAAKSQVIDAWTRTMKKYSKAKTELSASHNELFTDNAEIKDISENPIDIYATTLEKSSGSTELVVWFYLGGAYLSSARHPEAYLEGKKFLVEFSRTAKVAALEEQLALEEKKLRDIDREHKTLINKGANLEQDIARLDRQLQEAKDALNANKTMIGQQEAAVKEQEKVVEELQKEIKGKN